MKANADIFVEVSWEICNKVGGIYTVVSSKAAQMLSYYKQDSFFMVGPYFPKKAYGIFEEKLPPPEIKKVFEKLREMGIDCHYGVWNIQGEPIAILVDTANYQSQTNQIKKELWDQYQVDSLTTSFNDFGEPVLWGRAVGILLHELSKAYPRKKMVAQFHEWLAGSALLHLNNIKSRIGTVFTTHATMLGRTLATAGVNLYAELKNIDPQKEAFERGIQAKWLMEKECATNANVFTTVSEITGIEAEHLLGRKPDVLLFNGLDMAKFPSFEEVSIKHKLFKNKMKEFLLYYFFPYYSFDLANALLYFIAGRYEFHDKGIDIFISSLARLNNILKEEKSDQTIIAFFFVPGNIKGIRPELLQAKTQFQDVKDELEVDLPEIKNKILHALLSKKKLSQSTLFDKDIWKDLKTKIAKTKAKGNPPLSTHDLYNEETDEIISACKAQGLLNRKEDNVKIVYYPIYLTGADGLLNTSYYESMVGSHLGVFPSFYEPWGYTPLEAAALGVGSVTTDLAGFGRYISKEPSKSKQPGVWVLKRFNIPDNKVTDELTNTLHNFTHLTKQQRVENKIVARSLAQKADWKVFAKRYIEAHNLSIKK